MCLEYDFTPLPLLRWTCVAPFFERSRGWYEVEGSEQHWHWQQSVDSELLVGDEASDLIIAVSPLIVLPVECLNSNFKLLIHPRSTMNGIGSTHGKIVSIKRTLQATIIFKLTRDKLSPENKGERQPPEPSWFLHLCAAIQHTNSTCKYFTTHSTNCNLHALILLLGLFCTRT